jgi:hypothetical protein
MTTTRLARPIASLPPLSDPRQPRTIPLVVSTAWFGGWGPRVRP